MSCRRLANRSSGFILALALLAAAGTPPAQAARIDGEVVRECIGWFLPAWAGGYTRIERATRELGQALVSPAIDGAEGLKDSLDASVASLKSPDRLEVLTRAVYRQVPLPARSSAQGEATISDEELRARSQDLSRLAIRRLEAEGTARAISVIAEIPFRLGTGTPLLAELDRVFAPGSSGPATRIEAFELAFSRQWAQVQAAEQRLQEWADQQDRDRVWVLTDPHTGASHINVRPVSATDFLDAFERGVAVRSMRDRTGDIEAFLRERYVRPLQARLPR